MHQPARATKGLIYIVIVVLSCVLIPSISFAERKPEVKSIRYRNAGEYTRVVIDLTDETIFSENRIHNPDRVYIDVNGSILQPNVKKSINIEGNIINAVRVAQYDPQTVRVVLDLGKTDSYKVFRLSDPARIVIDVFGSTVEDANEKKTILARAKQEAKEKELAAWENRVAEEDARLAQERRLAEERKLAEEQLLARERRLEEERRVAEETRLAEEKAKEAEEADRLAELKRRSEEKAIKIAEARRAAEENKRSAEQARLAEAKRLEEQQRLEEEKRRIEEAARFAEEKRLAEEAAMLAEERRIAEEKRIEESHRLAEERRLAEGKQLAEAEEKLITEREDAMAEKLARVRKTAQLKEMFKPHRRLVVIDAGHGGHDPGAIGPGGVKEKDVVLDVAKRLKKAIEAKGDYEVVLTRDKDKYLSLEERTMVANNGDADLFISIHANAHNSKSVSGMETYFLRYSNEAEALKVAARENKISVRRMQKERSDTDVILASLQLDNNVHESMKLANLVQDSMVSRIGKRYGSVKDLGVKNALFYVLLGAKMPSVLVEVSFITNPTEAKRLETSAYREHLAAGIAVGVEEYFDKLQPEQKIAMRQ